jgi:hypothetical protein
MRRAVSGKSERPRVKMLTTIWTMAFCSAIRQRRGLVNAGKSSGNSGNAEKRQISETSKNRSNRKPGAPPEGFVWLEPETVGDTILATIDGRKNAIMTIQ